MMELTFETRSGAPRTLREPAGTLRPDGPLPRDPHALEMPAHFRQAGSPAQPERISRAQEWNARSRPLQRIEGVLAIAVLAGLFGLAALTFGEAIDTPAAAQPTSVAAMAASR